MHHSFRLIYSLRLPSVALLQHRGALKHADKGHPFFVETNRRDVVLQRQADYEAEKDIQKRFAVDFAARFAVGQAIYSMLKR